MNSWQKVETIPETMPAGDDSKNVLLWSKELGVVTGKIANLGYGQIHANVPCFHGNAITSWGVTHWQELPAPPEEV